MRSNSSSSSTGTHARARIIAFAVLGGSGHFTRLITTHSTPQHCSDIA